MQIDLINVWDFNNFVILINSSMIWDSHTKVMFKCYYKNLLYLLFIWLSYVTNLQILSFMLMDNL